MVVGNQHRGKIFPRRMGENEQRGIMDIVEAKCKKCGFVAYGSSVEEVNELACLLCGELLGNNPEISPEKEGPPGVAQLEDATEKMPLNVDETQKTRNKKNSVIAMKIIKSLLTVEFYKCVVLAVIAVTLIGIFLKIPTPFTLRNVQNKIVDLKDIPLVRVRGGDVDVNVTNTVEVEGAVNLSR